MPRTGAGMAARMAPLWALALLMTGASTQAATGPAGLLVSGHVSEHVGEQGEARNGQGALAFTWTNQGSAPVLLLTHADTDAGLMFDAIEIWQGPVQSAIKSPRKAVAPRFCVLPAGRSHTVHIAPLKPWLLRIGIDPAQPWQAVYRVADHVQAPPLPMPVCGAADTLPGALAPLWHGEAHTAWLSL